MFYVLRSTFYGNLWQWNCSIHSVWIPHPNILQNNSGCFFGRRRRRRHRAINSSNITSLDQLVSIDFHI